MHQKYTMAFSSSNVNLVFIVTLKITEFSISFSFILKIIFHNFGSRIVIMYLLFVSLKYTECKFENLSIASFSHENDMPKI